MRVGMGLAWEGYPNAPGCEALRGGLVQNVENGSHFLPRRRSKSRGRNDFFGVELWKIFLIVAANGTRVPPGFRAD
jgi:hypothetical protein